MDEFGEEGRDEVRIGFSGHFQNHLVRGGVTVNFVARQHTNSATTITTCKYSYLWSVIDANNVTSQGRGWRKVM